MVAIGRSNNSALYPDNPLDGMVIGKNRLFSLGAIMSSPVAAKGMVYVGSGEGFV